MITLLKPYEKKCILSSNKRQKSVQGRDELPLGVVGREALPLDERNIVSM